MGRLLLHKNRLVTAQTIVDYDTTPLPLTLPTDWLELPSISSGDTVVYLLAAIYENTNNHLALNCSGNYTVEWGDGIPVNYSANTKAETIIHWSGVSSSSFSTAGYRQAIVKVYPQSGATFTTFNMNVNHTSVRNTSYRKHWLEIKLSAPLLTTFTTSSAPLLGRFEWVGTNRFPSFQSFFSVWATSLQKITSLDVSSFVNTSLGLHAMFQNCTELREIPDASTWNFGPLCTNMDLMFNGCTKIKTIPYINFTNTILFSSVFALTTNLVVIPSINTSNVTSMVSTFQSSGIKKLELFDTSNVTNMTNMFYLTTRLDTVPAFNTPKLLNAGGMFRESKITTIPLFDTSKVTGINFNYAFYGATKLKTIPLFNMSGVTTLDYAFGLCSSLTDIPQINTSNVTNMSYMFTGAASLVKVPVLNFSNVTNSTYMFQNCTNLQTIDFDLNFNKVTNCSHMFNGCTNLTSFPSMSFSAATSTTHMFQSCNNLETIGSLNLSSTPSVLWLFIFAFKLKNIGSIITTSACTNFSAMHHQNRELLTVPVYNTIQATNMEHMFSGCFKLQEIPLLNTSKVINMGFMFQDCTELQKVPALQMSAVTITTSMLVSNIFLNKFEPINSTRGFNFANSNMGYNEIINVFNNLSTASGAQTINVTLTPGSISLSPSDRLICTNKGYTLLF